MNYSKEHPLRCFFAFAGYNSQALALEELKDAHPDFDYEIVGWSEIDKYAIMAHNALFPWAAGLNFGDISKIDWAKVPDFDFFTYSFPCTDVSNAGLQRGLEENSGTRSSLLWECRRAISIKRPSILMLENVSAFVSDKFRGELKKWLKELEGYGYKNFLPESYPREWSKDERKTKKWCLNSKNYGVPQNRERVFVISMLGGGDYTFPKPFKLNKTLNDVLEDKVDDKYYLSADVIRKFFKDEED